MTEAQNFRKKPVVIQASQWFKNGDHPLDYSRAHDGLEGGELRVFTGDERKANGWEGDIVRYFRHPEVGSETACKHCGVRMHEHGWIDTLEGGHVVCPGDWIITGVKGENYPCKPDIFAATYDLESATRPVIDLPLIDPGMLPQSQAVYTNVAPRVTPEHIQSLIAAEYSVTADNAFRNCPVMPGMDKVTICVLVLRNGAKVVGVNYGAIDDAGHNVEEGFKAARADAINQIWPLEGYLLRQRLHEGFKS